MHPLSTNPAETYRKIDLDARIEASSGAQLTLICLEEAVLALGQAIMAVERRGAGTPNEPLARAHGIAMWLAGNIAPDNPLKDALTQFYGAQVAAIARNRLRASAADLVAVRDDFADLLQAVRRG